MGFVTVTKDQARHAHASHYTKPFEVVQMTRSGPWDFPPYSWIYGISDIGSWNGLISTDGEKLVVTRSKYTDLASTKATYVFNKTDIDELKFGLFKANMKLKIKIPGLTKGSALRAIFVFPGIVVWLIPFIIALFMPQKNFQARLNNEFNNINEFKRLLEQ